MGQIAWSATLWCVKDNNTLIMPDNRVRGREERRRRRGWRLKKLWASSFGFGLVIPMKQCYDRVERSQCNLSEGNSSYYLKSVQYIPYSTATGED